MHAIWKLGFRPFFLLGNLYAVILILLWVLVQTGLVQWRFALSPIYWHAHEMLFGFTTAIVAGFILTASQNWTGIRGVHGNKLIFLVSLWSLARILSFFESAGSVFAIVDLAFYPSLCIFLIPYLKLKEQKRNHIFFVFFSLMFVSNLLILLSHWGFSSWARQGYYLALHTIIAMIVLIGGRVIPFFTQKAISNAKSKTWPTIERLSVASILVFAILFVFLSDSLAVAVVSAFAFVLHSVRWLGWNPRQSFSVPVLAILYLAYLWIPLGFLLYSLSYFGYLPMNIAAHAFGMGAIGIMIYGMVNRVSLGHTGRSIKASPLIIVGYVLVNLAVICRVFGAIAFPMYTFDAMKAAGILWICAYGILFIYNFAILTSPRIDGKEG